LPRSAGRRRRRSRQPGPGRRLAARAGKPGRARQLRAPFPRGPPLGRVAPARWGTMVMPRRPLTPPAPPTRIRQACEAQRAEGDGRHRADQADRADRDRGVGERVDLQRHREGRHLAADARPGRAGPQPPERRRLPQRTDVDSPALRGAPRRLPFKAWSPQWREPPSPGALPRGTRFLLPERLGAPGFLSTSGPGPAPHPGRSGRPGCRRSRGSAPAGPRRRLVGDRSPPSRRTARTCPG